MRAHRPLVIQHIATQSRRHRKHRLQSFANRRTVHPAGWRSGLAGEVVGEFHKGHELESTQFNRACKSRVSDYD